MPDFEIDLENYSDLDDRRYQYVIFGNGLSIGVNSSFAYGSLYNAAVELDIIRDDSKELFDAFSTKDFEYLLRKLSQASIVNKVLRLDHITPATKYNLIKQALITAVSRVHPRKTTINDLWLEQAHNFLAQKHSVFSLNYDLIPYWLAGVGGFDKFTDFFWSDTLTFDPTNLVPFYSKTRLYYPHGSLFLFEDIQGSISKIRSVDGSSALDQIGSYLENYNVPIFISEGTSDQKIRRIKNNTYLSFAYSKMHEMKNGVIIYGASLSRQDSHIIEAVQRSSVDKIAYGIYPHDKTAVDIETIKASIKQLFQDKKREFFFFDSTTCPLYYQRT